jgi:hypothetical protein
MGRTRRDSATASQELNSSDEKARAALALMVDALELIDATGSATVAGAHLDLAIHRLQEWIDSEGSK